MTREMLLEKSLDDLREVAKAIGIKAVTKYRKKELVELILKQGEQLRAESAAKEEQPASPKKSAPVKEEQPASPKKSASAKEEQPASPKKAAPAKRKEQPAEKKAKPTASELQAGVDYSPRRRGRPRKAMNDPGTQEPAPVHDRAAEAPSIPEPAPEEPAPAPEERRMRVPQPSRTQDRQRQYDRQGGRNQNQLRYNQNNQSRPYNERQDPPAPRDYQRGYQNQNYPPMQGYPSYPQYQQGYYPQEQGFGPAPDENRPVQQGYYNAEYGTSNPAVPEMLEAGDCGDAEGILEAVSEGFGFLRCENYLPGPKDVYISNAQIRRFRLKTGDKVTGKTRPQREGDKYPALLYITAVNDLPPEEITARRPFEELVPIFPDERLTLESRDAKAGERLAIRLIDLMSPIGKGQRGLIVSQPKAGKTTLLKNIANGISNNYPDITLIVLLIDERPEEVTDMQRSIKGEVVYS
ncbi:MAG: Rho termination factor N-terminal domain-containing protein, partial [Clostridia bacterium]|nr:Rho termination factor N-terminal domain-containing protein [Clostridia bacterium]